jgi:hypothetical protein
VSAPGGRFPPRSFAFNTLTPQQPEVTPAGTANRLFHPYPLDSTRVDACKHVNALFCAIDGCIALALLALTAELPQGNSAATRAG